MRPLELTSFNFVCVHVIQKLGPVFYTKITIPAVRIRCCDNRLQTLYSILSPAYSPLTTGLVTWCALQPSLTTTKELPPQFAIALIE